MRFSMRGLIASAGFASGDRFVVGAWLESPIGPFADVMWAAPDGTRTLLVPDTRAERFVRAVYGFDETRVVELVVTAQEAKQVELRAGPVTLGLQAGPGWPIPFPRPAAFTRWVEGPIARVTMRVRTYGVSPTGVREWYRSDCYRRVVAGRASVDGRDLGPPGPVDPACGFGFSEPPRGPSIVAVRPLLEDPTAALDTLLAALTTGS